MPADAPLPRFWWLKRLALAFVLVLIVWGSGHALLWHRGAAALDRHVQRWHAEGAPTPDQVVLAQGLPLGADNAAALIVEAQAALPPLTAEQGTYWDGAEIVLPLEGRQLEEMRGVAAQDRPAVQTLRRAWQAPRLDWMTPAVRIETILPRLSDHRFLANRLQCAAQVHHHDGDLAEALLYAHDVMLLGEAVVTDGPQTVTSLVGLGIQGLGASLITDHVVGRPVPGLPEEGQRELWRQAGPVARDLIALLLDDGTLREGILIGLAGDRTLYYSSYDAESGWAVYDPHLFGRPFIYHQVQRILTYQDELCDAVASAETWQDVTAWPGPPVAPEPRSIAEALASGFIHIFTDPSDRFALRAWQVKTDRRAAAVLLALRLYQAEHDGRLPESLDELVPDFLPHVPTDPFDPDRGALRYMPNAPVPLIYSVGGNGIDGGGDWTVTRAWGRGRWLLSDVPFLLDHPPGPALTTQALSDLLKAEPGADPDARTP